MNQLSALDRVCDKRHARMIQAGLSESEAASKVRDHIKGWLVRWGALKNGNPRQPHKNYGETLLQAYSS